MKKFIDWQIPEVLNHNDLRELAGYITHLLRDVPDYSMKGRTLESFKRQAREFHENIRRLALLKDAEKLNATWQGAPYQDWNATSQAGIYSIVQIKKGSVLAEEGIKMSHCVYSYWQQCVIGGCSIWSFTVTDKSGSTKRIATIEERGGRIVQVRGSYNQIIAEKLMQVVSAWAHREGLMVSGV